MRGPVALLTAALILGCAWLILLVAVPVLHIHTGPLTSVILVLALLSLLGGGTDWPAVPRLSLTAGGRGLRLKPGSTRF